MSVGARVLIVDDEPLVATALRRQLLRRGFAVETCASAEEALARVAGPEVELEVVITDFQMPRMNGLELLRELGRRAPRILRVLLSGYAYGEAEQSAWGPDFDLWVRKPWNADELASDLRRCLPTRRPPQS